MTLSLAAIETLARLATQATPGPWSADQRIDLACQDCDVPDAIRPDGYVQTVTITAPYAASVAHARRVVMDAGYTDEQSLQDAAFVAACDPSTALALCALAREALTRRSEGQPKREMTADEQAADGPVSR